MVRNIESYADMHNTHTHILCVLVFPSILVAVKRATRDFPLTKRPVETFLSINWTVSSAWLVSWFFFFLLTWIDYFLLVTIFLKSYKTYSVAASNLPVLQIVLWNHVFCSRSNLDLYLNFKLLNCVCVCVCICLRWFLIELLR